MVDSHQVLIIAAVDEKNGLGRGGRLPWRIKKETRYFLENTTRTSNPGKQNMVVMGRATWESLPEKFRPLPGRRNVVLSGDSEYKAPGALARHSLDAALASADEGIENIFVIGGARVYKEAVLHPAVDGIYLTRIKKDYHCDVFFPAIPKDFKSVQKLGIDEENGVQFEYLFYSK